MSKAWKGLVLAGGTGSRLHPLTKNSNKHLLPVYDKPMIYHPLTTLMLGGIRDIVLISGPDALPQFERLLGDGRQWGVTISYLAQPKPTGIADGLRIAAPALAGHNVALILGDNIFFGAGLGALVAQAAQANDGASVFAYEVANPEVFGVVTVDAGGRPLSIVEKPRDSPSRLAVTGLYLYGPDVFDVIGSLAPSARGELEITDVNNAYLAQKRLKVYQFGRGFAWLDGGTHRDLFSASQFIQVMEARTGLKIGCIEEVAFRMGYIGVQELAKIAAGMPKGEYADYLASLARAGRNRATMNSLFER